MLLPRIPIPSNHSTTGQMPDYHLGHMRQEFFDKAAVALLWTASILSLALILTRLIWRYRRGETYSKDDKWMAIALVPLLLRLVASHISNAYLTANFNHKLYPYSSMTQVEIYRRTIGSIMVLPSRLMYAGVLWAMKASILYWFERYTGMERPYGTMIKIARVAMIVSYLGVVVSTFVDCRPIQLYWQIWPDPGKCVGAKIQLIVMASLNMYALRSDILFALG